MEPQHEPAQFDFIMNPEQQHRSSGGGSSFAVKLLVIVGALFVVMILAVVVMNLLGGGGGTNKTALLSVAQDQTEIIRLADSGLESSVGQANKNFAVNLKLATSTQKTDLLTYMDSKGIKPKDKDLGLKQSASNDTVLANAKSSSTFDSAFKSVMRENLLTYQKDLNAAYGDADQAGQQVLKADFNATQLLLTQLSQI